MLFFIMFFCRKIGPIFLWSLEEGVLSYHLIQAQRNIFRAVGDLFPLTFVRFVNPIQGPLITDGRNSSKWTGHYEDWSKTLHMVKISEQKFCKIISKIGGVIERTYICETSSFGCKVSRRKAVLLQ